MYSYKTDTFYCKWDDWRKAPLSRCPIKPKIHRAINEGRSFSNPKSIQATSLRWEKDLWVLSMNICVFDMNKNPDDMDRAEFDIAIGRKGERAFMFRSPYIFDPSKNLIPIWDYDHENKKVDCSWKEPDAIHDTSPYQKAKNQSIISRLYDIGICIRGKRRIIGTKINEETKRPNKIYAAVQCLEVFPSVAYQRMSIDMNVTDVPDYSWEERTFVPLLVQGWYDPAGNLLVQTGEPKARL